MNVLIVGGTGFIGYHATRELVRRGHSVTVLARRPVNVAELFPPGVQMHVADLNRLSDDAVREIAGAHQAVVYAAGVHASTPYQGSAREFFTKENVKATARFFGLARSAGVKRGVLLGSYFCYFNRAWPDMRLAEHHPYIRSRVEQAKESLAAALPDLELMVLELPYIFGAMPGRRPSWAPLINYVRLPFPMFFIRGGTNSIAVTHVAEAIAGALEQGKAGETYQVGEANLTWTELLEWFARIMNLNKRAIVLPTPLVHAGCAGIQLTYRLRGKDGALQPAHLAQVQTSNCFFDPTPSRLALGYGQGGIEQALQDTVKACLN